MVKKKAVTYSEQDGKREESFNRAIKDIALVVRSDVWLLMASSMTSTASDPVTCLEELKLIGRKKYNDDQLKGLNIHLLPNNVNSDAAVMRSIYTKSRSQ